MSNESTAYTMLSVRYQGPSAFWLLLVCPIGAAAAALLLGQNPLVWAMTGFFGAIPLVIVTAIVIGARAGKRARAIWTSHDYAWYRATFPAHAHGEGRVSCRHCGSTRIDVARLMNRTFMRSHACSQCGETLYFSAEKI